jgi:hypothetical protein
MFKPQAQSSGITIFDRNRFEIGGGYLITDDLQVELSYANEFMPRDEVNEMYHIIQLTLTFNNPLPNLKKTLLGPSKEEEKD